MYRNHAYQGHDIELGSPRAIFADHLRDEIGTAENSARSSLEDEAFYSEQAVTVSIFDDLERETLSTNQARPRETYYLKGVNPEQIRQRLRARERTRTRWINVVGWSNEVIEEISTAYLGGHDCLKLENVTKHMLGGPTMGSDDSQFIWLQSQLWFVGRRTPEWASVRQIRFRMIVCLPTSEDAGTLITNFVGPFQLATEISTIFTTRVIEDHPMGTRTLGCAWILGFTVLRAMAEQLDFAFNVFDPIDSAHEISQIPHLGDLPLILEKSNRLARIDRYLSSLEELLAFFTSVRERFSIRHSSSQPPPFLSYNLVQHADLEASRAHKKIEHEQRLCKTYLRQFDTLVQLVISYGTSQITERLNQASHLTGQFSKIGMFLAAVAGVVAPMSLLTSFYGMNVKELTPGAGASLFEFWQIGVPIVLGTGICFAFVGIWMFTKGPS